MQFFLLHFSNSFLPAPPRSSKDSEDDENIGAKAAEDMNAQNEEDVDMHNDEVNDGPLEPMEDKNNKDNDTSKEFCTNKYQTGDGFAPPDIGADTASGMFTITSFHFSKSTFTEIEDVVHAGPILSVEHQVDPALTVQKCGCHTAPLDNNLVCNDSGCETLIGDVDLLRCVSPGCYLMVS